MKKLVKPGKNSMTLDVTSNIILTLDVGGTNFVFSALQHGKFITDTVCLPASIQTEDSCTATIIDGFEILKNAPQEFWWAVLIVYSGSFGLSTVSKIRGKK